MKSTLLPALCPTKPHDAAKKSTSPMMPRKTGFLFFQALSHDARQDQGAKLAADERR
jgi:hypothetical protein